MHEPTFEEIVETLLKDDSRYHREAYDFVREALDYTQKKIVKTPKAVVRHVSGQELLQGVREYALAQFGPMVLTLFEEWGILRCEDVGEIVFNMVESGLLSKTEKDQRQDFQNGYDFFEAFRKPYLPSGGGKVSLGASRPASVSTPKPTEA